MSFRPFGLVPSNLQRSVLENASKNINKPLTRATINTYNIYTQEQQQRPINSRQSRQYSTYYYIFPKIPRPKRNVFYYKVAYVSIVGSIGSKLTRGFSTRANNNNSSNPNALSNSTKRHAFIANTRKLFGKRRYSTNQQNTGQQQQQTGRKRRFLRSWLTLTSISVIFFGVVSRRYYPTFDQDDDEDEVIRPTSWPLYLYSRLPLNAVSRLWGQVNSINLPVWLREPAFKLYSKAFGVNLDEMLDPNLKNYSNLGDFFYREIRPETRPVDQNALLCSPCDGKVLKFGIINDGEIEQVKGMTYKIDALLGTTNSKKLAAPTHCISHSPQTHHSNIVVNRDEEFVKLNGDQYAQEGDQSIMNPSTSSIMSMTRSITATKTSKSTKKELFFTVIYLAPGDYHRYHSPTNWVATLRRHFVGELYSVAPYFQRTFNNLFVLNERVALLGYWEHGFFSMTPVGATNVGSIKLNFDSHLSTNEVYEHTIYSSTPTAIKQSDKPSESTPLLQSSKSTNSSSSESINTLSTNRAKKVKKNTCYEATYANASKVLGGQPLFKGEEMGGFRLGSTVVLVFEAPVNFKFDLEENQSVKMGQKIGGLE